MAVYDNYRNARKQRITELQCNPQTKEHWSILLDYLYQQWRIARLPVTYYAPPCYAKGALRLDGVIGGKRIGSIVQ